MSKISITVLCDNTAGKTGLLGEHGLSYFIQDGKQTLLFDTGAGYTLIHNSHILNIPLTSIDYLVLSHGHYDHTGGMKKLFRKADIKKVFAHPKVFRKRFVKDSNGDIREIGYRGPSPKILLQKTKYTPTTSPTKITKHILASGPIPRNVPFENSETNFFTDIKTQEKDPFEDDQCLIIDGRNNYFILLGCCHSGLINTLLYIQEQIIRYDKPLIIIGGLHLSNASEERLLETVSSLSQFKIQVIYPCHCSGYKTLLFFNKHLNTSCIPAYAGFHICG